MKKILLLNGAKKFAHSDGRYNLTLHETALAFFDRQGFEVKVTHIDEGYDVAEEVEKYLWADVVIYQMPGWWMGAPWIVKKYIDEVFTEGHGSLYASDGRTRSDASQKYGSGGLIQGKQYMLSLTWNAPQQAFDDPSDFFGHVVAFVDMGDLDVDTATVQHGQGGVMQGGVVAAIGVGELFAAVEQEDFFHGRVSRGCKCLDADYRPWPFGISGDAAKYI